MDDVLFDTSWTISSITTATTKYRNLFYSNSSSSSNQLSKLSERLSGYLQSHKPQYTDDLEDETERLGTLSSNTIDIIRFPTSSSSLSDQRSNNNNNTNINDDNGNIQASKGRALSLQIRYTKQTFKFVLSPDLLLHKSPASISKRIFNFLSDTFNITIDPLDLRPTTISTTPSTSPFLPDLLASYISDLSSPFTDGNGDVDSNNDNDESKKLALFKSTIGNLKLTISFSSDIAPDLKTLDIDIPYETVLNLSSLLDVTTTTRDHGIVFLTNLQRHITEQTGLMIPLVGRVGYLGGHDNENENEDGAGEQGDEKKEPPLRVSRITCAAWAISSDGKIKYASKAVEAMELLGMEEVVRNADTRVLGRIVDVAGRRRGKI